ncbi:hypothetical protein R3P38DRAFT_2770923 [Favolaschia claudopus]|uniref:Uncharacterized protein n=1 Tax=Favolaschia claudopus TaxID=2862362 RepID=A0AAW0CCU7_9AGAR
MFNIDSFDCLREISGLDTGTPGVCTETHRYGRTVWPPWRFTLKIDMGNGGSDHCFDGKRNLFWAVLELQNLEKISRGYEAATKLPVTFCHRVEQEIRFSDHTVPLGVQKGKRTQKGGKRKKKKETSNCQGRQGVTKFNSRYERGGEEDKLCLLNRLLHRK